MGDLEDEYYVDAASQKSLAAMAKLIDMKVKIDADMSNYYLADAKTDEEILREKHPGLQEAWERYQTILQLVKINE